MEKINTLLEKYNNFKDAQIRSIEQLPDSSKLVTIVLQDDDGEDLNSVKLEFSNIYESRILQNSVLPFLDMMSGLTIIKEHDRYGFALGHGTSMVHVQNAPLYIVSSEMKVEEE
jgi:hypothetical protein